MDMLSRLGGPDCLPEWEMPSDGPGGGAKEPGSPPEEEPAVVAEVMEWERSCASGRDEVDMELMVEMEVGLGMAGEPVPWSRVPVWGL